VEDIPAAGQYFVPVCLVTDIPDDLVKRGIIYIMKGYGKFDDPEAGAQMPGIARNFLNDEIPEFPANLQQVGFAQFFKIRRTVDRIQQ
jgi:hypothetical protein